MKKIFLITAILLCFVLTACNSSDKTTGGSASGNEIKNEETKAEEGYFFELNGTKIAVTAKMAPIAEALGEPTNYFESNSCAFQGLDKVYTYGSVVVRTYPENDTDYVLTVELKDDSVSTPEGISIGDTADSVKTTYGEPNQTTDSALIYTKGESILTFFVTEGEITAITYNCNK